MSYAMDTYGFSSFDPRLIDGRHLLLCPGCYRCQGSQPTWTYEDELAAAAAGN